MLIVVLYLTEKTSIEISTTMYLASTLKDDEIEFIWMQTGCTDPRIRTAQDDI